MTDPGPPALHALPAGMADLLPAEAAVEAWLAGRVMESFALHGYQRVGLPALELVRVLERGLGELDPRELVCFVEPETGELVAFRPDMTPQIARLVATRLGDREGPVRLAYQGSVLRRRRERARRQQQLPQAGIELVGLAAPEGDEETIRAACAAVRAAGLRRFHVELSHTGVARALMAPLTAEQRAALVEALAHKDATELGRRARDAALPTAVREALVELPALHGDVEVLEEAARLLDPTPARDALAELRALCSAVAAGVIAPSLGVDLGEAWDFDYYTGGTFRVLAEGAAERVGSGGRYDQLLGRFGAPRPACGFALDLVPLGRAARHQGGLPPSPPRVGVLAEAGAAQRLLAALRAAGVPAVRVGGPAGVALDRRELTHLAAEAGGGRWELRSPESRCECVDDAAVVAAAQTGRARDEGVARTGGA
ncbi:MAG: ATP phosphoribosyltransferase regulatory subunit [Polyangiaceae bacterium]|nr:ATP phosphoribosyltransferase regulatory subunit [Polyangiaceae bacterium]